jgi:hypothetical protein
VDWRDIVLFGATAASKSSASSWAADELRRRQPFGMPNAQLVTMTSPVQRRRLAPTVVARGIRATSGLNKVAKQRWDQRIGHRYAIEPVASYWHSAQSAAQPWFAVRGEEPLRISQAITGRIVGIGVRQSSGYLIQNSVSKSALPWRSYIWHTREPLTGQSSESWAACVERPVDPCGRAEATVIPLLLNVFRVIPRACSSQWRHSSQSTSRRTYSSPSLLGRYDARRANRKSGA